MIDCRYLVLRLEEDSTISWEPNARMDDPGRPSWGPKRYRTFKREKDAVRYAEGIDASVLKVIIDPATLKVETQWVTVYTP